MRRQRCTSASMILRYSSNPARGRSGQILGPVTQRLRAREDGGERVVDLVHHAGGQLPHRGQLLGLRQPLLGAPPFGHVFGDGDHVGDPHVVEAHRDLGDPEVARVAARGGFHLHLLDFAGLEHAVELAPQQIAGLAVQHAEDLPPHRVVARDALRPALALAVPGADDVVPVDHVQADGQRVDDAGDEGALGVGFPRGQRHLRGEILRQLGGGDDRRQQPGDHPPHVTHRPLGPSRHPPGARARQGPAPRTRAGSAIACHHPRCAHAPPHGGTTRRSGRSSGRRPRRRPSARGAGESRSPRRRAATAGHLPVPGHGAARRRRGPSASSVTNPAARISATSATTRSPAGGDSRVDPGIASLT